jgi:hypothetical protein
LPVAANSIMWRCIMYSKLIPLTVVSICSLELWRGR